MHDKFPYHIHTIKTVIYNPVSPIPGNNGYFELTINEADYNRWEKPKSTVRFPILSVWVDPNNPKVQNTCKVHALVPQDTNTPENLAGGFTAQEYLAASELAKEIRRHSPIDHGLCNQAMSVDEYTKILRYGVYGYDKSDIHNTGSYTSIETETNRAIPIWDNKSEALNNIIKFLVENSAMKLSGIDLINLNAVSDGILEQLGYNKVPDRLGVGVPMWSGDPLGSMQPEIYASRRWGSRLGGRHGDKIKETAEQFIKILEDELTANKGVAA